MQRIMLFIAMIFIGLSAMGQELKIPEAVKKAMAKLLEKPDDPSANLEVGKHLGFEMEDWDNALPYLSRGSDKALSTLSTKEQDSPKNATAKVSLGDEWMNVSLKYPKARQAICDHAISWYVKAWKEMEEGPEKRKLLEKSRKVSTPPFGASRGGGNVKGWKDFSMRDSGAALDGLYAHTGKFSASISSSVKSPRVNHPRIQTQEVVLPVGAKEAVVSVWVRSEGTDPKRDAIQAGFFTASVGGLGQGGPEFPGDIPFGVRVESKVQIPEGSALVSVWVVMYSEKGILWVDDVSVKCDGKELMVNGPIEK